ncbi:hypothetical protein E2C01_025913 [Portunus trituberculatus]|uniref:Uncharacterized protein n=1 Tax=Portunus trituberculatus TaxID=210409 RepID=A0A5B7EHF7_PORTR|nr:hypothetical protein [Portunus trituberculatus]
MTVVCLGLGRASPRRPLPLLRKVLALLRQDLRSGANMSPRQGKTAAPGQRALESTYTRALGIPHHGRGNGT